MYPFSQPYSSLMNSFHLYLALTLLLSKCLANMCSSEIGLSYSGFKVVQVDQFSLFPPSRTHQMLLCHCVNGQIRHSKRFDLDSTSIFKSPLCFLNTDLQPRSKQFPSKTNLDSTLSSLFGTKNPNNTWLNFVPATNSEIPPPNVCYWLARRNLYARLNLNIYVPHTFLGGFYQCKGSQKECRVDKYSISAPLVADDPRKHRYTFEKSSIRFARYTNFLKTASQLEKSVIEMTFSWDSWEKEVKINENYTLRV